MAVNAVNRSLDVSNTPGGESARVRQYESKTNHGETLNHLIQRSYSDFFKEQVNVANLLRQLMTAKGLSIEGHTVPASVCFDCLQTRTDLAREVVERDKKMEAEWAASHGGATEGSK